jgi:crossover junction endonuclease MUS81
METKTSRLNDLFLEWLQDWHKEAVNVNSKARFTLKKAIDSLSKCETSLNTAKEAVQLPGIGNGIVKKLEEKLESLQIQTQSSQQLEFTTPKKEKRKHKQKAYIPNYRSGAYAILAALHSKSIPMGKAEIQMIGQQHCDASFTIPHSVFKYTAWNSMKTLLEKNLVLKEGNLYELTQSGCDLAKKLGFDLVNSTAEASASQNINAEISNEKYFAPGSFEIICIIDGRERYDSLNRDIFLASFKKQNLLASSQTLEVGDFLWVAKCKTTGIEVVLDVIVERKRHDDFVASITTSRFKEQRQRLFKCKVPKVIYLLEAYRNNSSWDEFGMDKICTVISELELAFAFTVHHSQNIEETLYFLQSIHRALQAKYADQGISWANGERKTLAEFQSSASKSANLTVKDVWIRQLSSLRMMTVEKAKAIAKCYPTIRSLFEAYCACSSEKEKEQLLSQITISKNEKNIGTKLSAFIYEAFQ